MRESGLSLGRVVFAIFLGSMVAGARIANGGDLNPPAGPITPTHKTLTEVEPRIAINASNTPGDANSLFKITQRGSFYLTGNIQGVAAKHGIEIAASGVTLDLNGFDLLGVVGSLDGVNVSLAGQSNISVINGSVRNWGGDGVDLQSSNSTNSRIANLLSGGNLGNGLHIGSGSTVTGCSAYVNAGHGISVFIGCNVSNSTAYQNSGNGIVTISGCTVSDCSAVVNTGNGIVTSTSCTISNCLAFFNTTNGISAGPNCTVSNCSAVSNTGHGIITGGGNSIQNCSTNNNTSNGISAGTDCTIMNCTASSNDASGISVITGSQVIDSAARSNAVDGIVCTIHCIIRGNACSFNGTVGGAGIHVTGGFNRIESNNCTSGDRGIDVDAGGNIIIKNTCSGNTPNWDIAIGNSIGPIVVAGTTAAAISGNGPSPSALGSTDPTANYSY